MLKPDINTLKAAVPGTIAMIQERLRIGCSHSHALDIVAAAHQCRDFNTAKGLAEHAPAATFDILPHLRAVATSEGDSCFKAYSFKSKRT
jgi:hypothetical protein